MPFKIEIQPLWNLQVKESFNTLLVGRTFRHSNTSLLLGSEDGVVRMYHMNSLHSAGVTTSKPNLILETKGGPIQAMHIHNIANFGSLELITADSRGMITVFSKQQILDRRSVSNHGLNSLQVDKDAAGNIEIVAGDVEGQVHSVLPFSNLWKLRLPQTNNRSPKDKQQSSEGVGQLLAARLYSSTSGIATNYILASDRAKNLHFIQQGALVLSLPTGTCVKAMCSGHFMSLPDETDIPEMKSGIDHQVALGGEDGTISIMSNFKLSELQYANVHLPITQMLRLPSVQNDGKDSLLCSGHFNSVFLYHSAICLAKYQTSDWVIAMSLSEVDKEGKQEVVIGCRDKQITAIKVT
nr:uncharacterized protein LOC129264307 [Lytechinus pictus]